MMDFTGLGVSQSPALPQFGGGIDSLANQANERAASERNILRQMPTARESLGVASANALGAAGGAVESSIKLRQAYGDRATFSQLLDEVQQKGVDPTLVDAVRKQAGDMTNGELNRSLFKAYIFDQLKAAVQPQQEAGDRYTEEPYFDAYKKANPAIAALPALKSVMGAAGETIDSYQPSNVKKLKEGVDWGKMDIIARAQLQSDVLEVPVNGRPHIKVRMNSDQGQQLLKKLLQDINPYIKEISGAAVSSQEMRRLMVAFGIPEAAAESFTATQVSSTASADKVLNDAIDKTNKQGIYLDPLAVRGAVAGWILALKKKLKEDNDARIQGNIGGADVAHAQGINRYLSAYVPDESEAQLQEYAKDIEGLEYVMPAYTAEAKAGSIGQYAKMEGSIAGTKDAFKQGTKEDTLTSSQAFANAHRQMSRLKEEGKWDATFYRVSNNLGPIMTKDIGSMTTGEKQKAIAVFTAAGMPALAEYLTTGQAATNVYKSLADALAEMAKGPASSRPKWGYGHAKEESK